eukprot:gene23322-30562_t
MSAMPAHKRRSIVLALGLATASGVGVATTSGAGGEGFLCHGENGGQHDQNHPGYASALLKEEGSNASEKIRGAGELLLRSCRAAASDASGLLWRRLDPDTHPASTSVSSFASAAAARWISGCCESPGRREHVASFGGGILVDWMLKVACDDPSREQREAERALVLLLSSDTSATSVLARPGAVPRILRQVALGKASDSLDHVLEVYCSVAADSAIKETGLLSLSASTSAKSMAHMKWWMHPDQGGRGHEFQRDSARFQDRNGSLLSSGFWFTNAPLDDMRQTMQLMQGRYGLRTQHLATSFLASWAEASDAYRHKPTALGIHPLAPAHMQGRHGLRTQHLATSFLASWAEASDAYRHKPTALGIHPPAPAPVLTPCPPPALILPTSLTDARATWLAHTAPTHILQGLMMQGRHGLRTQHLATSFLASWAEASDANRHKLTGLGIHMAIESIARDAIEQPEGVERAVDQMWELTRLVRAMSQGAPAVAGATSGSAHHLACCVEPLLYVAADALARQQDHLAAYAIDTLALMCGPSGGEPVRAAVRDSNMEPLLRELATAGGLRPELQRIVVHAVGALAQHGSLPEEMVPHWRDWVLDLLCVGLDIGLQPKTEALFQADDALALLRQECVQSLHGLASTPGTAGQQVAHYWLAAMLRRLADRVAPYNSLKYKDGESAARAADDMVDVVSVRPSYFATELIATELRDALDATAEDLHNVPDFDFDRSPSIQRLGKMKEKEALRKAAQAIDACTAANTALAIDACTAAKCVSDAFQVLNDMVAPDPEKQRWLISMGVLPLMQLLLGSTSEVPTFTGRAPPPTHTSQSNPGGTAKFGGPGTGPGSDYVPTTSHLRGGPLTGGAAHNRYLVQGSKEGALAEIPACFNSSALQLCLARQAARLLSQLVLQQTAQQEIREPMWDAWLQGKTNRFWGVEAAVNASDCWLANYATKALLNLEAAKGRGESVRGAVLKDAIHLLKPSAGHHWRLSTTGKQ